MITSSPDYLSVTAIKSVDNPAPSAAGTLAMPLRADGGADFFGSITDPSVVRDRALQMMSNNQSQSYRDTGIDFGSKDGRQMINALANKRIAEREAELGRPLSGNEQLAILDAFKQQTENKDLLFSVVNSNGTVSPKMGQDFIDQFGFKARVTSGLKKTGEILEDAADRTTKTVQAVASPTGISTIAFAAVAALVIFARR